MFQYVKSEKQDVYQIKTDGTLYVFLSKSAQHLQLQMARWCLEAASHLGSEQQADWMMIQCVNWLNLAEQAGIALRKLQGNDARMIDVIDLGNPDDEAIRLSSGQLFLEQEPIEEKCPDDYCGLLMRLAEGCETLKQVYAQALGMSKDEMMKKVLKGWIRCLEEMRFAYRQVIAQMTHDSERHFSDDYENERAWELDSGNYIDPKTPVFHEFE